MIIKIEFEIFNGVNPIRRQSDRLIRRRSDRLIRRQPIVAQYVKHPGS